jgi:hypothetical protein
MRAALGIVVAAAFLTSCGRGAERAERDLAECRLQVAAILPAEVANPSDNFKELIDSCMIAKGYDAEFSVGCFSRRSEECYAPPKWYKWSN